MAAYLGKAEFRQSRDGRRFCRHHDSIGIGGLSKMLGMLKMSENIEVHGDMVFRFGSGANTP
jgi:hypothetical protein